MALLFVVIILWLAPFQCVAPLAVNNLHSTQNKWWNDNSLSSASLVASSTL